MRVGRAISRRSLLQGATALGAAAAMGQLVSCSSSDRSPSDDTDGPRQNVIVILADDMRYDELAQMPQVHEALVAKGVSFTGARHNIALCSPARAGFLTGQMSKRHRVRSQNDAFGRLNDEGNTLPVWMSAAGYDTALIGKYFTPAAARSSVPGWRFQRILADDNQEQYGFSVWNGEEEVHPTADQTSYLRGEVLAFLQSATEPYFLWFTPTADHWPLQPPPGHEGDATDLEWPDAREADVTDKPPWIQSLPPISDAQLADVRETQRLRVRELLGLDDTIGEMARVLEDLGHDDRTVVVFASDNGVFQGEHRIPLLSKNLPYEPSVRVPCIVRAPGLEPGEVGQPAHMLIDLTATCVAVSGSSPGLDLDGVSLLAIAGDPAAHQDRQLLYDRDDRDDSFDCPAAAGVFTSTRKLVRYETTPPTVELYDLDRDLDELENVAEDVDYADDRRQLEAALDALLSD